LYRLLPEAFDVRLIPVAYGIGYVAGVVVAILNSARRGTTLREEAAEMPLYVGAAFAVCYASHLLGRLLSVS
jgi:hypothetical protein